MEFHSISDGQPVRLNVGCGKRYRDDYVNIDVVAPIDGKHPDILADAKAIPLPDGCADELMAIHLLEHEFRWNVDGLIVEWKRLLKPNGLLVLELPDLLKCCKNIISEFTIPGKDPDQQGMFGLYGDPRLQDPWMTHKWSWSPKTLRALLKQHGFVSIIDAETKWHPAGRIRRDMRMEARKPK